MTGLGFPLAWRLGQQAVLQVAGVTALAASYVQLSRAAARWVCLKPYNSSCSFGLLLPNSSRNKVSSGNKNSSGRKLWLPRDGGSLCCQKASPRGLLAWCQKRNECLESDCWTLGHRRLAPTHILWDQSCNISSCLFKLHYKFVSLQPQLGTKTLCCFITCGWNNDSRENFISCLLGQETYAGPPRWVLLHILAMHV